MIGAWLRRRQAPPEPPKPIEINGFGVPFDALAEPPAADYRGLPTLECPCGSDWFLLCARYDRDTRLPGFIVLDGRCASCGSWVTLPTPIDGDAQ